MRSKSQAATRVNKPENDDPSIIEPIELTTACMTAILHEERLRRSDKTPSIMPLRPRRPKRRASATGADVSAAPDRITAADCALCFKETALPRGSRPTDRARREPWRTQPWRFGGSRSLRRWPFLRAGHVAHAPFLTAGHRLYQGEILQDLRHVLDRRGEPGQKREGHQDDEREQHALGLWSRASWRSVTSELDHVVRQCSGLQR
jgi:hypothetical protein